MAERELEQAKKHGVTLRARGYIHVTGVTDVESFDESTVVLRTHGGRLILTGSELHVSSLMLEEGRLQLEGVIDSAAYDGGAGRRRSGFLRRALG